ncbi:MAG: hypothetical protein ACXW25_00395 [Rhodospirillales bacterium]
MKREDVGSVVLDCEARDPADRPLVTGTIEVLAPKQKQRFPWRELPKVQLRREERYLQLLRMCEGLPSLSTAVVHPCSEDALEDAIEAAKVNLITPILVGPKKRIQAVADGAGIDISPYRLVAADHSHHSAELAVALVRSGEAQALMKGSLHTDELLHE